MYTSIQFLIYFNAILNSNKSKYKFHITKYINHGLYTCTLFSRFINSRSNVKPTRFVFGHASRTSRFIIIHASIISKGCIANNVRDYENDQDNDVNDRDLSPALLDAG